MHDFCFTIPYGLILIGGGIVGFAKKGSTASLAGGVGTGLLLVSAGYLSLKAFEKKKNSYFAIVIETVCAALLTAVMAQRYMETSKIMPAGIVAGISFGVAGGIGYGGCLELVFGAGMSCNVSFGFGNGRGLGYGIGLDANKSKTTISDSQRRFAIDY
ncbi:protein FATTY ACID EXPORT 6 [Citrus sinensis]|uniref:Protein FATTY ACID EXPORT 6 n=1 Tax=Citrus sinensis TaxID=2711 RepID=A0ACB8P0B7_CITSI|nr:protein FATTY ACID EXPORT 6 [Citrus sinensis]